MTEPARGRLAPASGIVARALVAYALLATFWAGGALGEVRLVHIDLGWLDAPSIFGALADLVGFDALRGWPGSLFRLTDGLLGPDEDGQFHRSYALASLIGAVLAPLALGWLFGARTPAALGLRRPSAAAWPILALACAASVPLSIGMAMTTTFQDALATRVAGSPYYLLAIVVGGGAEHVFFHGVLLAWLHPSGRFPQSPELAAPLVLPFRPRDGGRTTLRDTIGSLRIPSHCLPACLLSAPLFFAIHAGASDGELLLSLPAGVIFAWLAYRTGGFALPGILHVGVSLVAAIVVLLVG